MNIEQTTINDLKTLLINSPAASASTVQIWFRAGSSLETHDEEGIAHFLEHMFFKGTPRYPGPKIAHAIESFGGEVNAFTSFDYTCYYINAPSKNLLEATDILLDMVANPLFTLDEIPAEREVVFEEYRRALDNPSQFHFMQLQKSSMTGGYAHPILGREDTIKNFTQDQVKSFRKKFYNLQNAMLVIAGNLEHKNELLDKIKSFSLPTGVTSDFSNFKLSDVSTIDVHEKPVRQATLTIAIQSPSYHSEETAAQDLAINCLAHGETSYFYQKLVAQSSLCNGVAGSTMYFAKGGCHFLKMNFPKENLEKILSTINTILENILKDGFKEDDLQKIKNQYLASKVYEKESIEAYAFSLGHSFAQDGNIFCEEEFINRIKEANLVIVNKAIRTIFSHPIQISLQLPENSEPNKKFKMLQSGLSKIEKTIKNIKSIKDSSMKEITTDLDPQVKVVELRKGIKLLYRQNKMTPTFVLHAYLKGGLTDENAKNCGAQSLLSRLMNYGYQGFSYESLKKDLEDKSASLNGFSGKNAFGLTLHGQSTHFSDLVKHFTQTLLKPEIPQKYFNHERKILLRMLENQKEDPVKICFKKYNQLVFNGHPYALDLSGTPSTLKSFTHTSLKNTHKNILKNNELLISYFGDKDLESVSLEILKYFPKTICETPKKRKKISPKPIKNEVHHIELKREQTHIMIGGPAYKLTDEEDIYLKMITSHLSGQSSELFVEVRDKQGLCYAVQPVHNSALEAGSWGIYIGSGSDKKDKAIKAIIDLLNRLGSEGLTPVEFNRIKSMIEGQVQLSLQTNEDWAQFYSIAFLHGLGLDFPYKMHDQIRNASHEKFQAFLKKFMNQKWNIISVGP